MVFLPGLVVLAELAALPVEDVAGQRVAAFAPAEHVMDRAAICRVVDVFEHVQGLDYPAEFGQGAGEAGRGRAALQGAQDRRGTTMPARSETDKEHYPQRKPPPPPPPHPPPGPPHHPRPAPGHP